MARERESQQVEEDANGEHVVEQDVEAVVEETVGGSGGNETVAETEVDEEVDDEATQVDEKDEEEREEEMVLEAAVVEGETAAEEDAREMAFAEEIVEENEVVHASIFNTGEDGNTTGDEEDAVPLPRSVVHSAADAARMLGINRGRGKHPLGFNVKRRRKVLRDKCVCSFYPPYLSFPHSSVSVSHVQYSRNYKTGH